MFDVDLRPEQLDAVYQLDNGKILCGGVGSGKSRTSIAYFVKMVGLGSTPINGDGEFRWFEKPLDLYIITTAKKRDSSEWLEECARFGISTEPTDREDGVSVQIDSWNNIGKYVGVKDSFFIFDEQRLVGSGAWVKSFLKIVKDNRWILLSATPGDTWLDYIPVFVANGFVKNRTEFKDDYVIYKPGSKYPRVVGYRGEKRLRKWRNSLLVSMPVRRHTKRHNLSLMSKWDKDRFDTVLKRRWNPYDECPVENVAQLFYLMRKVVNSDGERLWHILNLLKTNPRLIIFYNFDYELEILRGLRGESNVKVGEWNGHVHDPLPTGDRWVYLVQYTAGAEGWNCTTTDTVVFYSLSYSWRTMEQAYGRIDRLNTPYTDLYCYTIRSNSPIDVEILKALRAKKTFNERSSGLS